MDYTDAVAAFFVPREEGTALPAAVAEGSPARRLRDACEPVAMHAVWSQQTNERLAQLGLDFLTSYVGGRGASLGEPAGARRGQSVPRPIGARAGPLSGASSGVSAAAAPLAGSRAPMMTCTPCCASWRDVSKPMPLLAPVTSAILLIKNP